MVLNLQMKFLDVILLLALTVSGCTTQSSANAKARMAYLAGQNAALRQQQAAQFSGVTILGPVQTSQVPWVEGLTLAQAIATANYLDSHAPKQIIITRNDESATVDPKVLMNGTDIPLEIGDVSELRP